MNTNEERAIRVIARNMGQKDETIKREANFASDLRCDSLDMVELAMGIEDEFGIEIPDEHIEPIKTVGDLVDYINGRLSVTTVGP